MHVAIAGNIGSGKTTLTNLLSKHYGWDTHFEDVDQNPYLNDFYIQDRTIYEDAFIFAPNLHSMGLMTTRDFENYFSLFNLMDSFVSAPDLLIYLRASVPTLVNQIQQRGRDYEESIRLDYLKRLNERYEAWISTYDKGQLLIIDVDNNRFPENQEDLGKIINAIDAEINGLF
jgi:deoxyadenosine/deoxycytidine kinase